MDQLTLQMLKDMTPHTIFATGVAHDEAHALNMTGSGKALRWIAVRGGIHDWAIYCHFQEYSPDWIQDHGDKVHSDVHIKMLVPCDDEAFAMYRH